MAEPTLLERLRGLDLLAPEQLAELSGLPESKESDPRVLGKVILQRGWLTRFQISLVASGKGKDLSVGSYLLLDKLGEGGMGQVFKARHKHMNRLVALKLMRKEKLASADSVSRFYQEVQAAAALVHPNIALAFDAGQAGTSHFFSMEFIDGPDLTRLVRDKGVLPVAQACDFIRQAALGLQHAHERGLVHRDIKPSNLLVSSAEGGQATVKILDLGLARLGDSFQKERNLTKMGQVIGTPDYLAPEQALAAHNVDIRADIYSLGCSLFFLLAGRAPFQAETLAELLLKHQMEKAPSIRSIRPEVPAALEALMRRLMAKNREDRPDTPEEVADALEPFTRGEAGVVEEPVRFTAAPSATDRTWSGLTDDGEEMVKRPAKRTSRDRSRDTIDEEPPPSRKGKHKKQEKSSALPLIIGAAAGGGVLLIGLIVGLVLLLRPGNSQPSPQASHTEPDKSKGKPSDKDTEKDRPDNTVPVKAPAVSREGDHARFTGHLAKPVELAVSTDGRQAASGDAGGLVLLWNLETLTPGKSLGRLHAPVTGLAFTDGNRHLVAAANDKLHEWDIATGNKIGKERPGAWLAPATQLALTVERKPGEQTLHIWQMATGQPKAAVILPDDRVMDVAISSLGTHAYVLGHHKILIVDLVAPRVVMSINNGTGNSQGTAICGQTATDLLIGESSGTLRRINVDPNKAHRFLRGGARSPVNALAMTADGAKVLVGSVNGEITLTDESPGGTPSKFVAHIGAVQRVCFCPDGRHALSRRRRQHRLVLRLDQRDSETHHADQSNPASGRPEAGRRQGRWSGTRVPPQPNPQPGPGLHQGNGRGDDSHERFSEPFWTESSQDAPHLFDRPSREPAAPRRDFCGLQNSCRGGPLQHRLPVRHRVGQAESDPGAPE